MDQNTRKGGALSPFDIIAGLALLAGLINAVLYWARRDSFWEDEIIAVTHVLQPLPTFFVEVLRNDIHPFLYFLLLKVWALGGLGSDAWMLASSLFGALVSVAVITAVTYRLHGPRAALWAAGLFALLPTFAYAASNLRMYGLMPAIAVGCWYANRQTLRTGSLRWAFVLILLQWAEAYTHAIGFFFAAFFALASLLEHRKELTAQRFARWLAAQVMTAVGMLPVVGSALVRGTEPLGGASVANLLSFPGKLLAIWGAPADTVAIGVIIFVILAAFGLRSKSTRISVLVIPCGALITCMAVSLLGKEMFKPPVFTANLAPFLAMGAAVGITTSQSLLSRLAALAGIAAMGATVPLTATWYHPLENYKPAARYLASNVQTGDVVVIPSLSVYWGIARYAVHENWGAPLAILPLQDNEQWTKLKRTMGPAWAQRLGLNPTSNQIEHNGVSYVVGTDVAGNIADHNRVWTVKRRAYEERGQEQVDLANLTQTSRELFGDELVVSLHDRTP